MIRKANPLILSAALCTPAIVAHSLAKEAIEQKRADAIMNRIYDVSGSARGEEMMAEIIKAKTGGSLAGVLGKKL